MSVGFADPGAAVGRRAGVTMAAGAVDTAAGTVVTDGMAAGIATGKTGALCDMKIKPRASLWL